MANNAGEKELAKFICAGKVTVDS